MPILLNEMKMNDWIQISLDPIIHIATSGIIEIDDTCILLEDGLTPYRMMFTFQNDPNEALMLSKLQSEDMIIDHSRCWSGSIFKRKNKKGYWINKCYNNNF